MEHQSYNGIFLGINGIWSLTAIRMFPIRNSVLITERR
jgi:hypothetical protein